MHPESRLSAERAPNSNWLFVRLAFPFIRLLYFIYLSLSIPLHHTYSIQSVGTSRRTPLGNSALHWFRGSQCYQVATKDGKRGKGDGK